MANKLSVEKINQLWLAWQQKQNISFVSKKCHVHRKTVQAYKQSEKWDQRLDKIKQLAQEKSDLKQAEQNAKFLKIAEQTIQMYAESLTKLATRKCPHCGKQIKIATPKIKITPLHFAKMVELIRSEFQQDQVKKLAEKSIQLDELSLSLRKEILIQLRQKFNKNEGM